MLHKKIEGSENLRPVEMKKRTSFWNASGMEHRKNLATGSPRREWHSEGEVASARAATWEIPSLYSKKTIFLLWGTSRGLLQPTQSSDLSLLPLFQWYQKSVSLCPTPASIASDTDVRDTEWNNGHVKIHHHSYPFLSITPFVCSWQTEVFASQYALGISSALPLSTSLSCQPCTTQHAVRKWRQFVNRRCCAGPVCAALSN